MTIEPGSMLATHYRVERVIGEGGMGIVVEAVHEITERRVAIKRLLPHVAANREAAARLLNEATAACRSRHPNVIEIHDVIRDGDSTLLIMELLQGESLRDALERGKMPTRELLERLIPAMRGVAEAHRQGVIHRDIHPANIFFARSEQGEVVTKVLDFGICKLAQTDPIRDNLTRSGTTMGIPMYMSYEQLTNARGVDGRSDVYSFGVVLYEALSGCAPYAGDSYAEIAIAMINQRPTPLLSRCPDVPEPLARIIERAIAHERDRRTPSLDTLADELRDFLAQEEGAALLQGAAVPSERDINTLPVRRAPQPVATKRRHTWIGVALAGAVLLALIAALASRTLEEAASASPPVRPEVPTAALHAAEPAPEAAEATQATEATQGTQARQAAEASQQAGELQRVAPTEPVEPSPELPRGRDLVAPGERSEADSLVPGRKRSPALASGKRIAKPATEPSVALEPEPTLGDSRLHRATKLKLDPDDFH